MPDPNSPRPPAGVFRSCLLSLSLFGGLAVAGKLIGDKVSRDHGGQIICTGDGRINIEIGRIEGIDPHAIRQGILYLCDPSTIGFGYANPRWIWL